LDHRPIPPRGDSVLQTEMASGIVQESVYRTARHTDCGFPHEGIAHARLIRHRSECAGNGHEGRCCAAASLIGDTLIAFGLHFAWMP